MSPVEAPESPYATAPANGSAANTYPYASPEHYLSLAPITLKRIVDCVKPERYDERIEDGRFTLREAIAHLADFEVTILDRITISQEEPGTIVANFDEDARAKQKDYSHRDIHHELEVFENRRRDTLSYLVGIPSDMRGLSFVHPQRGEMTVDKFTAFIVGHDLYHVEHATQYLR